LFAALEIAPTRQDCCRVGVLSRERRNDATVEHWQRRLSDFFNRPLTASH